MLVIVVTILSNLLILYGYSKHLEKEFRILENRVDEKIKEEIILTNLKPSRDKRKRPF